MKLRPYQKTLIKMILQKKRQGEHSIIAQLSCGGGKSIIQGAIARMITQKGKYVLFLVHRKELCEQITDTFRQCGVDMTYCEVAMVQTVSKRLEQNSRKSPSVIITDECHHSTSKSYKKVYNYYPKALRIGFTATPCRLDKSGLREIYSAMVQGPSTKWLIKHKYLSPYIYYGTKIVETDGLRTRQGEFIARDIDALMNKRIVFGQAYENWKKFAEGKKTIIYCANIELSKKTAREFEQHNISAAHLDARSKADVRNQIIQEFWDGKITVLCNVDLFGEGLDVPDCECVLLLRPTMSLALHIQQSMRSMRYKEGKTAIIIDCVGNVYRHGLPDDIRDWSLEGQDKGKSSIRIKECPGCLVCLRANARECPECGYKFAIESTECSDMESMETELERIARHDLLAKKPYLDYRKIKTWEEMEEFRKARNYNLVWSLRKCVELGIPTPEEYEPTVKGFRNYR